MEDKKEFSPYVIFMRHGVKKYGNNDRFINTFRFDSHTKENYKVTQKIIISKFADVSKSIKRKLNIGMVISSPLSRCTFLGTTALHTFGNETSNIKFSKNAIEYLGNQKNKLDKGGRGIPVSDERFFYPGTAMILKNMLGFDDLGKLVKENIPKFKIRVHELLEEAVRECRNNGNCDVFVATHGFVISELYEKLKPEGYKSKFYPNEFGYVIYEVNTGKIFLGI